MSKVIEEITNLGQSNRPSDLILDMMKLSNLNFGVLYEDEEALAKTKVNELRALFDLSVTDPGRHMHIDIRRDLYKELEDARTELKDLIDG